MSRVIASLSMASLGVAASLSATTNGAAVDVSRFAGIAKVVLNSAAMGGTTPTSITKLQHSDNGTTGWTDVPHATFAQVNGAAASLQELLINTDRFKKFVRVVDTLGGTTPTVVRSVTLVGKLAY